MWSRQVYEVAWMAGAKYWAATLLGALFRMTLGFTNEVSRAVNQPVRPDGRAGVR